MKINELVSILVPVYNIEKTIEKNINILIEKVSPFFMNFEIIISDDGSSDNSKEEIKKICTNFQNNNTNKNLKNIIGIYARENQGKGHALKRACEMSSGEYIIFCDGDMEIDPSQLENFFVIMQKENADVVIGSKRHKDSVVNYSNIRKLISFIYPTSLS